MKKLLLILILVSLWTANSWAQVNAYVFSSSAGTYSEISGGTLLTTSADDENFNANNIGFTFTYNGTAYTQFSVNNNGFIAMGASVSSNSTALSSGTTNNVIAAGNEDLQTGATGSELRYELSGTTPNQVLTIQWKNYRHYYATDESYNFQIKLYETSNLIQFVYGSYTKNTTNRTQQVGLRGASNADFNNRTTTTDWSATTAGTTNTASCTLSTTVLPTNGLTFTFSLPTCYPPTGITATAITNSTATISWTAPSTAPANGYQYEVRTSGAAGSGANGLTVSGSTGAGVVTANINGLAAQTTYYVYVRSDCGAGDYSNWAVVTFTTLCDAITTLPYTESFEGASFPPDCWHNTGWEHSSYGDPHTGSEFAYSNLSGSILTSPAFVLNNNSRLKYWYIAEDAEYPQDMDVLLSTDGINFTTTLASYVGIASDTYTEAVIDLSAYTGQTVTIRFNSLTGGGGYDYGVLIDDVTMELIPACEAPTTLTATNITTTSADLGWTETGTATLWNIELGLPGFTPGTSTNLTGVTGTTSNPWTATGGTSNTTYEFYVQADCGGTLSAWSGPFSFTTLCDNITTYPWTENFDTMSVIGASIIPSCWTIESESGTPWKSLNAASSSYNDPFSAPNYLGCYYSPSSTNKYLITPPLSFVAGNAYEFSFKYAGDGYSGWTLDARYNTSPTGTGSTMMGTAYLNGGASSSTYNSASNIFYPTVSGTYYFIVHVNSTYAPYGYLGLDDFMVTETPVPVPVISSLENTTGCVGSALVIHGTDLAGATSVTIGGTAATITANTATAVTVTIGTGTTGTVSVTTPGGTATSTETFTVNQLPSVFTVSGGGSYCAGGTGVTITLDGSVSGVNYELSTTPVTTLAGTGSALTFGPSAFETGVYTVTAVDPSTTCSIIMTGNANVTVKPIPSAVTASASSSTICEGNSIDLFSSANSNADNSVNYTEGFETWPPTGWTFINAGLGYDWDASTESHTGSASMYYLYDEYNPANAWGITGPLLLDAGTTYTVSFWYKVDWDSYPEKLKVTVGNAATVVAQSEVLWNNNGGSSLTNENWAQGTVTYIPTLSGAYYFGFNCYSDANMDALYVDDISITGTTINPPSYSWTSNPAGFTSTDQNPVGVVPPAAGSIDYIVTASNTFGCSNTATTTVVVDPCTGINENNDGIVVSIVPNPSNGMFYLNVEGINEAVTMNIYSINGQVIYSEQVDNTGLTNKPIDLKSYPKGMYFLRLINSNMTHTEKIIIE